MAKEEWLDYVELPDGQSAELLLRYPNERATMIEQARERDMAVTQALLTEAGTTAKVQRPTWTGWADIVLRASLWRATLKHSLTGEIVSAEDIGMVDDKIVKKLRLRALTNYVKWYDEAYPGPKEPSGTDDKTPTGESPELFETSESSTSSDQESAAQ